MLVFVYGSLKRGFPLHSILKGSKYVGTVPLEGFTLHSAGAFPYMVPCVNGTVLGELYDVTSETLWQLDRIEQNGKLYKREVIASYAGKEVSAYLAHEVQDAGFSEWTGQQNDSDELYQLAIELLEDGIDYNAWQTLRNLIDCDLDNYIRECEGRVYLSENFWNN